MGVDFYLFEKEEINDREDKLIFLGEYTHMYAYILMGWVDRNIKPITYDDNVISYIEIHGCYMKDLQRMLHYAKKIISTKPEQEVYSKLQFLFPLYHLFDMNYMEDWDVEYLRCLKELSERIDRIVERNNDKDLFDREFYYNIQGL